MFSYKNIQELGKAGIGFQEAISGVEIIETDKLEIEHLNSLEAIGTINPEQQLKLYNIREENRGMHWRPPQTGIELLRDERGCPETVYDGGDSWGELLREKAKQQQQPIFLNPKDKINIRDVEIKRSKAGNLLLVGKEFTLLVGVGKKGIYMMIFDTMANF